MAATLRPTFARHRLRSDALSWLPPGIVTPRGSVPANRPREANTCGVSGHCAKHPPVRGRLDDQ